MNTRSCTKSLLQQLEIQNLNSLEKPRNSDSPTSSILKTPTAIFVSSRSSSTKRLKFANGPADLENLKNTAHEYIAGINSNFETAESLESNLDCDVDGDGELMSIDNRIEVAVSPSKTMQVSPESWNAFLEYKKYHDYPNETEKTDYTYSRLSKFRHKEIIPGFLIRPNLSRSSISSSRRSSIFSPGNQSSINESLLSYDFKIHSSSNSETDFDLKASANNNNNSKSSRSKYYLRSSTFEDANIGEIDSKPIYFEKEYFSDSAPEWSMKKSSSKSSVQHGVRPEMTSDSVKSRYFNKVRSLDLDDADIDEIDDSKVERDKDYRGNSKTWTEYSPESMRTVSGYFSSFFTAIFLYMTAAGTRTKNLFLKHILRREDSVLSDRDFAYSTAGGSNISWTNEKPYTSDYYYYSGRHHGSGGGIWYQSLSSYIQDRFLKISNLLLGKEATRYSSYGYQQQSSKKRKFWWFLIPILILTGFWLYKEDQKHGIISGQYKALDCRTNGFLTATENSIKSIWRWNYYNYKRIASSASCYVNDSWERIKLPFAHFNEKFSPYGFLQAIWNGSGLALWNVFNFLRDVFFYFIYSLVEFLTDLTNAIGNTFYYGFEFFNNFCFAIVDGFVWFAGGFMRYLKGIVLNMGSLLGTTSFPSREILENDVTETPKEICHVQKNAGEQSMKTEDFNTISWDLSDMRKKLLELETEVGKGRESIKSRNEFYDKQLEENYLALQKYQGMVNDALISSKKPEKVSDSDMKYVLDNHSNDLKQWILQNFVLKADSPTSNFDESKISFLIAKYGNKTGEELLSAKEKFQQVLIRYREELDSLRKELTSLTSHSIQGKDISVAYVKKLVEDAIKLYDADKTGRVDYALETAGGQVQSIRCTETYIASPKSYILLGWAVYTKTSSPRDAITPGMAAGQCWAFVGSQGFLVLQLSHTIRVTGFTMEHISKLLVPKGHIESAPKNFSVWGLKSEYDVEPYLFGEYTYLDNDETLQYFPVIHQTSEKYNMVELKITSNHGNPNYTCLYRFRVHGDLNPIQL